MYYQVQGMLRLERIFEPDGIQQELDIYNPLIADGLNWEATFMPDTDVNERRAVLARLSGIEKVVWVQVGDKEKIFPVCNEDLDRETDSKTSAVHFMHF